AMLLEGRSGAHTVLGLRLAGLAGDKAHEFNSMNSGERLAFLTKEIDKYSGAIDLYSKSFEALSSTFKDNAGRFLQLATAPLFERIKDQLGKANAWFDG